MSKWIIIAKPNSSERTIIKSKEVRINEPWKSSDIRTNGFVPTSSRGMRYQTEMPCIHIDFMKIWDQIRTRNIIDWPIIRSRSEIS